MPRFLGACLLSLCSLLAGTASSAEPVADAEAMAERMLSALGGRAAWAGLRNTVNDSLQFRLEEPTVVRAVIRMDFTQPYFFDDRKSASGCC